MDLKDHIDIYEFMDQSGDPSHYACWGHVDSDLFREECFKEYSVKPLVVQHSWQKTKNVIQSKKSKKHRTRTRTESVSCNQNDRNAMAITIGIVPSKEIERDLDEFDIN